MIALPENVTLVASGESVDLPDRTLTPSPFDALVIYDGDWFHAVTVVPNDDVALQEALDFLLRVAAER